MCPSTSGSTIPAFHYSLPAPDQTSQHTRATEVQIGGRARNSRESAKSLQRLANAGCPVKHQRSVNSVRQQNIQVFAGYLKATFVYEKKEDSFACLCSCRRFN